MVLTKPPISPMSIKLLSSWIFIHTTKRIFDSSLYPISFIHLQSLANLDISLKEITTIPLNYGIIQATTSSLFTI